MASRWRDGMFRPALSVYRLGLSAGERTIMIGLAHDGLHNPGPDRQMGLSPMLGVPPWDHLHQDPYNGAAEQLLGDE